MKEKIAKELISVIVPVYNVEAYMEKSLDSIRAQTYSNIEVIVIDDASTDESGRICDAYEALDSRFRTLHFPVNRGPSAARNEGIRRAKGSLIAFIDSDDYVEPNLLERLCQNREENKADGSICGADGIRIKGGPPAVYEPEEAIMCLAKGTPFNLVPWGKLYRTELVKKNLFDEKIYYSEDLLFLYQILKEARRVSYLPDQLYHYVNREGSQVHSSVGARKCTALLAHDRVCEDACCHFPDAFMDFRQLALDTDMRIAIMAVKAGTVQGSPLHYLKIVKRNIRRHFFLKSLKGFGRKRDGAAVLMLYVSAWLFRGCAALFYQFVKPMGDQGASKKKDP